MWLRHSRRRAIGAASPTVWGVALILGVAVAYGVILFTLGVEALTRFTYGEGTTQLAQGARGLDPGRTFIVPVIGGILVGTMLWIAVRLGILRDIRCQGVAEVIEARASPPGYLSLRSGAVATVVSATALGCGASAGREGPLVAMGGSIATFFSQRLKIPAKDARTLLGCAAAAAVSAAFNAPIAGVLFALEVVLSNYALSIFGPVTLSSVSALVVTQLHFENTHRFEIPDYVTPGVGALPLGALLGILCGIVAWTFLQSAAKARRTALGLMRRRIPAPFMPMIAGLGMGTIGMFLPEVLGFGYEATSEAIQGSYSLKLLLLLLVAKLFATVLCLSCRFGTGVFSGGIYLGTITGAAFGTVLGAIFPEVAGYGATFFAMIGMGAVSGAIIGAPISTTLIVFEITGDYQMTATLMIAVGIASMIVQVLFGSSWFHYQLNHRGYDLSDGPQGIILKTIRVRDVMRAMPVDAAPLEKGAARLVATETLGEALAQMTDLGLDGMPVVPHEDSDKIIGTLTQIRALKTYNAALIESHIEHHR
ncbi:voltage-gated chloride channel family protein [Parvularcula bermudensis HTCC2503]|uniref:Voltage-gated chloride channel family protein n=1 Tax=Parvularcula bermudensis (strain ATCC BAA-594 / HTCC2503 / KCTC 12087) TaxID=314260 RepID=E0TID0_PARBH|nr:voltage-gated chloride channel family protein [Parvularcula bermudensis HTCC2503]